MAHSRAKKDWISKAISPENKGKLHNMLDVSPDKKIPAKKLEKAIHSNNPSIKKAAVLAKTLKRYH